MKLLSESGAVAAANRLKMEFAATVREKYEHKAKACAACESPGACCLDAHFVNVHITRLEAAAIGKVLARMPEEKREKVYQRIEDAVETYELSAEGDTFRQKFACPLYEKGSGCLVHHEGKPLPCIQHACYEAAEDLPPDELVAEYAAKIESLNRRAYAKPPRWLPLPVWLSRNHLR